MLRYQSYVLLSLSFVIPYQGPVEGAGRAMMETPVTRESLRIAFYLSQRTRN